MSGRQFFGYGSLVNGATHDFPGCQPATLKGWRRVWVHTTLRPYAFLSVEPADTTIDGVVATVPDGDWAALDHRERAYQRQPASISLHVDGGAVRAQVYSVLPSHAAPPDVIHPLRLSYIDVVTQGYLRLFGEAGAARFFETTHGWHAPIVNDRGAPLYDRHQPLSAMQMDFVDACLNALSAQVINIDTARPGPR